MPYTALSLTMRHVVQQANRLICQIELRKAKRHWPTDVTSF
jgi:hypothetical protein